MSIDLPLIIGTRSRDQHRADHQYLHAAARPAVSPLWYGAKGDGAANDTAALQASVNAAVAGSRHLIIPAGTYRCTGPITVASNLHISGAGTASVLHMAGIDPDNTATNYNLFTLPNGTENLTIDHLAFMGDFPDLITWTNGNSAAIHGLGSYAYATHNKNITIEHCLFKGLDGHPVMGGGDRWSVCNNVIEHCGNGLNVSAYHMTYAFNRHWYSEGIETAYGGAVIMGNTFDYPLIGAGVSVGGANQVGVDMPGILVIGNTISHSESLSPSIVIAENAPNAVIAYNAIQYSKGQGITVQGFDEGLRSVNVQIVGNVLQDVAHGINIGSSNAGTVVRGNVVAIGERAADYPTIASLVCHGPGTLVSGNRFDGLVVLATNSGETILTPDNVFDWSALVVSAGASYTLGTAMRLRSPNGTRYQVTVADDGTLSATPA